jgi:hypothetical protein
MNTLNKEEELLTRALTRAAGQLTPERLRPLAAPSREGRARWRASSPRLAPAAAALAVVLVVALAMFVTSGHHQARIPGGAADGSQAQAAAGTPRYYAEAEGRLVGWHGPNSVQIVVRATASGAVVARIPDPAVPEAKKVMPLSVAAAPDDRTFYALYSTWGRSPGDLWIYRFRITTSDTVTGLTRVNGGVMTGQSYLANVGGFAVSPDGSQIALAMADTHTGNSAAEAVAGEIVVLDLRTGGHAIWRGGLDQARQIFGIQSLSWTGDGKSLVYLAKWCPPGDVSYAGYGGYTCEILGSSQHPSQGAGFEQVRELKVTVGGGALNSGPVLFRPSGQFPFLVDPGGTELTTIVTTRSDALEVARISIATGRVTSVIGQIPPDGAALGTDGLAADSTGDYVLAWTPGIASTGFSFSHGWVRAGMYHPLAPASFPASSNAGYYQMTW